MASLPMCDILRVKIVEDLKKLFDNCPASVFRESPIERLCLLSFQMRMKAFTLDIFHDQVNTLANSGAVDTFI
jgi:hypothetical protein